MTAAQYYRLNAADRRAWAEEMPARCMVCGCTNSWPSFEVHELERRSAAPGRWCVRCNLLLTCHLCHVTVLASMPHEVQLALKFIADPAHYNLAEWLKILDPLLRAPNRILQSDVDAEVKRILSRGN